MSTPEDDAKVQKHYAVAVWNTAPTKIKCACGAIFQGNDAVIQQQEHMNVQNLLTGFEQALDQALKEDVAQELERRNVFDKDDKDKESP